MNNRQNGRRRGRNNNQRPQGGMSGGNRNIDQGNRIDSRARGNAAQLLEKYRNMARDAQLAGDRVMTEYYLQFADHYFRVLSDTRQRQEEQRARYEDRDAERGDRQQDDSDGQGNEAEDGDDTLDAIDQIGRAPRNRDRGREGRERDGNREGRDRDNRQREPRRERAEEDGQRAERQERPERGERAERSDREERPRRSRRERPEREDDAAVGIDIAVLPPAIGVEPMRDEVREAAAGAEETAPAPKRRGRPRKADTATSEGEAVSG